MSRPGFTTFRSAIKDCFRYLQERYETSHLPPALPTGFAELDDLTLGLWPGDLTLIAAPPGAGATSLALNVIAHTAFDLGKTVALFSLDLRAEEISLRLIAERGQVELGSLLTGRVDATEWTRFSTAVSALVEFRVMIDDSLTLSVAELRSRVTELASNTKVDLVVVDRLQNLRSPGAEPDIESQDASNARALKALARELEVPVIALSRFDHDPDWFPIRLGGPNKEHLRSPVAHAADTVLYLNRDTTRMRQDSESTTAWLILARHRRGQCAKIKLEFDGRYGRFSDPNF
jgi:replicative DNA helicase